MKGARFFLLFNCLAWPLIAKIDCRLSLLTTFHGTTYSSHPLSAVETAPAPVRTPVRPAPLPMPTPVPTPSPTPVERPPRHAPKRGDPLRPTRPVTDPKNLDSPSELYQQDHTMSDFWDSLPPRMRDILKEKTNEERNKLLKDFVAKNSSELGSSTTIDKTQVMRLIAEKLNRIDQQITPLETQHQEALIKLVRKVLEEHYGKEVADKVTTKLSKELPATPHEMLPRNAQQIIKKESDTNETPTAFAPDTETLDFHSAVSLIDSQVKAPDAPKDIDIQADVFGREIYNMLAASNGRVGMHMMVDLYGSDLRDISPQLLALYKEKHLLDRLGNYLELEFLDHVDQLRSPSRTPPWLNSGARTENLSGSANSTSATSGPPSFFKRPPASALPPPISPPKVPLPLQPGLDPESLSIGRVITNVEFETRTDDQGDFVVLKDARADATGHDIWVLTHEAFKGAFQVATATEASKRENLSPIERLYIESRTNGPVAEKRQNIYGLIVEKEFSNYLDTMAETWIGRKLNRQEYLAITERTFSWLDKNQIQELMSKAFGNPLLRDTPQELHWLKEWGLFDDTLLTMPAKKK